MNATEDRASLAGARRRRRSIFLGLAGALVAGFCLMLLATLGHDPATFRFPATPPPSGPVDLVAFGDSIAAGQCSVSGGFLARIAEDLETARPGSRFSNEAQSGARVATMLARLRRPTPGASAVVVVVGANDVQFLTWPPSFAGDLRASLAAIHAADPTAPVVLFGVPDISERRQMVPSWLAGFYSVTAHYYDTIVRTAASDHGATFFDFYALSHEAVAKDPRYVCFDRVHPNEAGYRLLGIRVEPTIRRAFGF